MTIKNNEDTSTIHHDKKVSSVANSDNQLTIH